MILDVLQEGASYTFAYLGKDVTVKVKNGKTIIV